jgi:hypothetical protein
MQKPNKTAADKAVTTDGSSWEAEREYSRAVREHWAEEDRARAERAESCAIARNPLRQHKEKSKTSIPADQPHHTGGAAMNLPITDKPKSYEAKQWRKEYIKLFKQLEKLTNAAQATLTDPQSAGVREQLGHTVHDSWALLSKVGK